MYNLRPYQQDALNKIMWAIEQNLSGNNIIVLPTGAGKSIVIARLAIALNQPILILQPSKEILEQNLAKLLKYIDRSQVGVYSASMDEKTINNFTFATIQSIYKKPDFFRQFKIVIIDECHLVNPRNLEGMFTTFLQKIGNPKVFGLTATPYRMASSYMNWGTTQARVVASIKLINRMKGFFWQRILFNIDVGELIKNGYLCPLEYIDRSIVQQHEIPLNISRTDFDLDSYEEIVSTKEKEILKAINYGESVSKSVLVFCSSVKQATNLSEKVPHAEVISAKTTTKERERIINGFKDHSIKTVFNVGVLTTGFDHPALDCIVLLRPTRSIALYYQMLGRGVRIAPDKKSCKIIDLTSTVQNIGRIETIRLVRRDNLKWELESEKRSNWHDTELYNFIFEKGSKRAELKDESPYPLDPISQFINRKKYRI